MSAPHTRYGDQHTAGLATTGGRPTSDQVDVEHQIEAWQQVAASFLLAHTEATRSAYAGDLRSYLNWAAEHDVEPLLATRVHLDAWAGHLREAALSPATINGRLAAVSGFYAYALDEGLVARSPVTRVRRPTVGEHQVSTGLSRVELTNLITAAEHDPAGAVAATW